MDATLFVLQRRIGEQLLAAGWHASSIAAASTPGSAWILFDPTRRIKVRMSADYCDVLAEATATHIPGSPDTSPLWKLTVHHAPPDVVAAALRAAPPAPDGGTGRDRRTITRAIVAAGMRPDRSSLARALSGTGVWLGPDHEAEAVWEAPHSTKVGRWTVVTPTAHVEAAPVIPAAVLTPLITATSPGTGTGAGGTTEAV